MSESEPRVLTSDEMELVAALEDCVKSRSKLLIDVPTLLKQYYERRVWDRKQKMTEPPNED